MKQIAPFDHERILGYETDTVIKTLADLLECKICLNAVAREPHACSRGHLHCQPCFQNLYDKKQCSFCKEDLKGPQDAHPRRTGRSDSVKEQWLQHYRDAESCRLMSQVLEIKCSNHEEGCPATYACDLHAARAHELACEFRPMICACEARTPREDFLQHARDCKHFFRAVREQFESAQDGLKERRRAAHTNRANRRTLCPKHGRCEKVRAGECSYKHPACRNGSVCYYASRGACNFYHPKAEIACQNVDKCTAKCPYNHSAAPYACAYATNVFAAAEDVVHTSDALRVCLQHEGFPVFCGGARCAHTHAHCASIAVTADKKVRVTDFPFEGIENDEEIRNIIEGRQVIEGDDFIRNYLEMMNQLNEEQQYERPITYLVERLFARQRVLFYGQDDEWVTDEENDPDGYYGQNFSNDDDDDDDDVSNLYGGNNSDDDDDDDNQDDDDENDNGNRNNNNQDEDDDDDSGGQHQDMLALYDAYE